MLDTGEPDLHPVLCLHSLFLDPRMFDGLVEAGRGRLRFVRPELPGQGSRVGDATATVSMDEAAEDVLRTVDELGLDRVSVVAASMGGDVAVRVAARRPGLVERLVLTGSSVRAEPADQLAQFEAVTDQVERDGFTPEMVEVVMGILFGASTLADAARADVHEVWRSRIAALPSALAHAVRGVVQRESAVGLCDQVGAATLVVSGTEDVARPPAWSDEMFDLIPDAQLWRLKRVGHSPLLEAPGLVTPRVLEFLAAGRGEPAAVPR